MSGPPVAPGPPPVTPWFSSYHHSVILACALQGMARVRSGQAPAWPLVSGRSVRRELEGRARTLSGPSPELGFRDHVVVLGYDQVLVGDAPVRYAIGLTTGALAL